MIAALEDKGDPKIEMQQILNKIGDVTVLMLVALQVLHQKMESR